MKKNHRDLKVKERENLFEALFKSGREDEEHKLWEMEEKCRALLELCPYPVLVLKGPNQTEGLNRLSLECLGYSREELLGKPFVHFLTPKSAERFTAWVPQLSLMERPCDCFQFIRKNGEIIPLRLEAYPITDKDKRVHSLLCVLQEQEVEAFSPRKRRKYEPWNYLAERVKITAELNETRQMLEETRRQLFRSERLALFGQMISGVAHELNNLLTSVSGFSQLILTTHRLSPSVHRDLTKIFEESQRAGAIVQNLQKFGRHHSATRSAVHVHSIIDRTVELMEYTLRVNNIQVEKNYDPDVPSLWVDSYQLQQVLLNILQNAEYAITSTQRPGLIRITSQLMAEEKKVRLTFYNNGPHIPYGSLEKIFQPFFTTKPEDQGTGLGLFISYTIIKDHGGLIQVSSKKNEGVNLTIELPIPQDMAAEATSPKPITVPPMVQSPARKNILVVDDEVPLVELMEKALSSRGHKVDHVLKGEEAVEKIMHGEYDLILCDIKMPGQSGPRIYQAIKKLAPLKAQKFIFCTGDTMCEATLKFLAQHSLPRLEKPFRLEEVFRLIDSCASDDNQPSS